jgi:hypothetical protein
MNKYRATFIGWEVGKVICEIIHGEYEFLYPESEDWIDFEAEFLKEAAAMVLGDFYKSDIERGYYWNYKDLLLYHIEGHEGWLIWDQRLEG